MANFKLNGVTVASESGGTVTLDSGVTGAFKSSTPVSGDLLQHRFVHRDTSNAQVISSSTDDSMSGPLTITTPAFDTTSETGTVWSIEGYTGINNEGASSNWNASMKFWVSYDGGSNWSNATPGTAYTGTYLGYWDDDNAYTYLYMKIYNTGIPVSQSNTKFGVCFFSDEGDNTRFGITDGGSTWLSCNQYKI